MKTNNATVALSSCDTDISSDPSSAASSNEMHLFCLFLQKDPSEQPEHQYDEFGFRVDTEGNTQFFCPLFPTLVEFLNLSQETWMHIFISGRGGYILYTDWLRERESLWVMTCSLTIFLSCWWWQICFVPLEILIISSKPVLVLCAEIIQYFASVYFLHSADCWQILMFAAIFAHIN